MNKVIFILPALIFAVLAYMSASKIIDELYPSPISEPLAYMEFMEFSMEEGVGEITSTDDFPKKIFLLNIFNSTCKACEQEHPQLMGLAQNYSISIYGIAYGDQVENIRSFLGTQGNPYEKIAIASHVHDFKNLNANSTPASFIIDAKGNIRYRHYGIIFPKDIEKIILPLMNKIEQGS